MLGLGAVAQKIFGSSNERVVKKHQKTVDAINALEPEIEALDDEALKAKTAEFRTRLEDGETLDRLLIEAFACVREAAKRSIGLRHFDVQLVGGIVLHQGNIAEMKTGEGKTLVATLAAYLNALGGQGVHVVTVNDYLAQRDASWMGQVFAKLGMTTRWIISNMHEDERRFAYKADITYCTNNELGFDYLRDNGKFSRDDMVQRPFNFAVVDEVDSILVDEARTPLIISGPTEDKSDLYIRVDKLVQGLGEGDYEHDEKSRSATLTEQGSEKVEQILEGAGLLEGKSLYDIDNTPLVHHVDQALKAQVVFEKDKDYIVKDDKVILIDEFTGRMMEGRRLSGGLHQAIEAKEGVAIQPENQTLASITFQNYFRMYPKLSGMTGTAATEAAEFADIYGLDVVEIPTNVPVARADEHDEFYRTAEEKYAALVDEIRDAQERGQPVLVGTVSIEKSEVLSAFLKKAKVKHQVLDARYHEQEANIVAQAGRPGAVTIATNMAGRGTDIKLGGNIDMRIEQEVDKDLDEAKREKLIAKITAENEADKQKVLEAGGLYVIGTERHESRRIDNQLRGRSGRQGDPGRSKFYLSLQDDLMRIFGPERMDGMLVRLGIEEGEAIVHPWLNKAIEKAQQKVEARNYDIRKNLLKYDDVMNDQRKVIYEQRLEVMDAGDVAETVKDMRRESVEAIVATHIPAKSYAEQWDIDGLKVEMHEVLGIDAPLEAWRDEDGIDENEFISRLSDLADRKLAEKAARYSPDMWRRVEKGILLQIIDQEWKDHLGTLDYLRQAVGLRAYGQRDPLNEYKAEAFALFERMLENVRRTLTQVLSHMELRVEGQEERDFAAPQEPQQVIARHDAPEQMIGSGHSSGAANLAPAGSGRITNSGGTVVAREAAGQIDPNDPSTWGRVARNAPCPCGSGKKYKHCHGAI